MVLNIEKAVVGKVWEEESEGESLTDGVTALVLVPTRELCLQVCAVAEQVVHRFHWLVPGCVMGGENRSKEKARLRKGQ
jgi:superfamily II DNA/RNA helicase